MRRHACGERHNNHVHASTWVPLHATLGGYYGYGWGGMYSRYSREDLCSVIESSSTACRRHLLWPGERDEEPQQLQKVSGRRGVCGEEMKKQGSAEVRYRPPARAPLVVEPLISSESVKQG